MSVLGSQPVDSKFTWSSSPRITVADRASLGAGDELGRPGSQSHHTETDVGTSSLLEMRTLR